MPFGPVKRETSDAEPGSCLRSTTQMQLWHRLRRVRMCPENNELDFSEVPLEARDCPLMKRTVRSRTCGPRPCNDDEGEPTHGRYGRRQTPAINSQFRRDY